MSVNPRPTIFIGSTFKDLETHRSLVISTLNMLQAYIQAMEIWGALPGVALKECLAKVGLADTYIGIIGMRYGSLGPSSLSITEHEYMEAFSTGKNIYIYLIDEEKHSVLPKFVETGPGAEKLQTFKKLLMSRHHCATFNSPEDLALKVGIGLIHRFIDQSRVESVEAEFKASLPKFLLKAGYSLGLTSNVVDIPLVLEPESAERMTLTDHRLELALSAAYIATSIADGKFDVLDSVLTFDPDYWRCLTALTRVFGVDGEEFSKAISLEKDATKFRLMVDLAGRVPIPETTSAICRTFLYHYHFHWEFNAIAAQSARPVADVVKASLIAMPASASPIIAEYLQRARDSKRWQQKRVFEQVLRKRGESAS